MKRLYDCYQKSQCSEMFVIGKNSEMMEKLTPWFALRNGGSLHPEMVSVLSCHESRAGGSTNRIGVMSVENNAIPC